MQCFAKPAKRLQRFAAVGGLRIDDFVVHPPQLLRPLIEQLAGALFNPEIVLPENQGDGR